MIQPSNKEAINIAVSFFKGNVALSLAAIAILVTLALLKVVPFIGIAFAFAYSILSFAIQIFVARQIPELQESEAIADVAARTKLGDFLTRHLDIATGGFLGIFLILMVLAMVFIQVLGMSIDSQSINSGNMQALTASIDTTGAIGSLLLMMIVSMWLGYLLPGVMGEVMTSSTFAEAFFKSFLLFNPRFWKRTLNKDYFLLVLLWTVIVFVAAMVISWFTVSIFLLPVALIGIYFLSLYNAAVYYFARELLTKEA